jgi:hypothetical protein
MKNERTVLVDVEILRKRALGTRGNKNDVARFLETSRDIG